MPIQRSEAGIDPCSLIESSSTDREAVRVVLDDLGDGRVPGLPASGSDGDGEADEFQGQGLGIATQVEAIPGGIGETCTPPARNACWWHPDGLWRRFIAVEVTRPVVHQDTPALEQVRAGIGRLHPVPNHMRQGRLDHPPGMVRLPPNSVKVFTGLYLYRVDRLMVPPLVTLNQRGFGIRFAAWGSNRSVKPWSPSAVRGRRSEQNRRITCDCRYSQPRPGPSHHGLTEQ